MRLLNQYYQRSHALILLCLVPLLSSCSQKVTTKTEYLAPPQVYLLPCPQTPFTGETYGDAIDYLVVVMSERELCAKQVDSVRNWVDTRSKAQ